MRKRIYVKPTECVKRLGEVGWYLYEYGEDESGDSDYIIFKNSNDDWVTLTYLYESMERADDCISFSPSMATGEAYPSVTLSLNELTLFADFINSFDILDDLKDYLPMFYKKGA